MVFVANENSDGYIFQCLIPYASGVEVTVTIALAGFHGVCVNYMIHFLQMHHFTYS